MRHLFTWLLVIGVLAGLHGRVLGATLAGCSDCGHDHHHCEVTGKPDHGPDHDHGDDKCPPDHHHHYGACIHNLPLGLESDLTHRLPLPGFSRSAVRDESERLPDGPFPALDKPPLI